MSRAAQLDCQHERSCALVLTLFLFQKGQGFFPPLPIAALLPRSRRGATLPLAGWDASMWHEYFCSAKGQRDFKSTLASACQISPIAMQQWGFKHEKSKERKKGCHLWMASFLRFIAANLSLTHAVTAVSPR